MLLLKPAIGLFSWYAYSVVQRKGLEKGTYAAMQILSEMRTELGDASQIPSIGEKMKEASNIKDVVVILEDDSWIPIAGDCVKISKDVDAVVRVINSRAADDVVACCHSQDGSNSALFGRRTPSNKSLRELVSTRTQKMEIVEDIYERVNWNSKINECQPLSEVVMMMASSNATTTTDTTTTATKNDIQGAYTFCYRDYVNHEEMLGMMGKRWGMERFLFHPARAGELIVGDDGITCSLTEKAKMFGFLPVSIKWEGSIQQDGTIVWETTSMKMGFKRFGQKYFDRPPAAEKLRADPWQIKVVLGDEDGDGSESSYGDILCFLREGKGHLVFAKDECLQQQTATSGSFGLRKRKRHLQKEPVLAYQPKNSSVEVQQLANAP
jgi:hypothetical protein